MLDLTIIIAFIAMISWGVGDFFIQKVVKKIGDVEALAYIGLIGVIGLLPFVINDLNLLLFKENLLLLLVLGIIVFIVSVINFEALKRGKLSVVEVILEIELPITILLAFIFLKEVLSISQFILVLFVFIGIVLVAKKSFSTDIFKKIEKGAILGVIAAIGFGVINVLTATSSKNISPIMAVLFPWLIFTIICVYTIYKRNEFSNFISKGKKFKTWIIIMGLLDTIAWALYALSISKNEVSIITAITESYPAVALFLGVYFNREKINWHQYLGAIISLVASFILGFLI